MEKIYKEKHPDAMLSDIAKNFGGLASKAFDAFKHIGIS